MNQPNNVAKTLEFFKKNSIQYQLSRNVEASNCRDAANKRTRRGQIGIPLADELKTYFGEYQNEADSKSLVVINLPGDCRIDFAKIRDLLGTREMITLATPSVMRLFGIEFGEVNPFLIHEVYHDKRINGRFLDLVMLFDKSLVSRQSTMLTNAGDLTWGIEFRCADVIKGFDHVVGDQSFIEKKDVNK